MRRPARPSVLNEKLKSVAMLFGGSSASWSLTPAAETVTVQVSLRRKSMSGLKVKVSGPPVRTAVWTPLSVQLMLTAVGARSTGSLKVIETFESSGTWVAPPFGSVSATAGALSPVPHGARTWWPYCAASASPR